MKAMWKGAVLAQSDETVVVEHKHYFPQTALRGEHLRPSGKTSVCPSKGTASYYDVVVDGEVNQAAAYFYREPSEAAGELRNHVAFWRGVTIES